MAINWGFVLKRLNCLKEGIALLRKQQAAAASSEQEKSPTAPQAPKLVYQGRKRLLNDLLTYILSTNNNSDKYYIRLDLKKHAAKQPSISVEYVSPSKGCVQVLAKGLDSVKQAVNVAVQHFNKQLDDLK